MHIGNLGQVEHWSMTVVYDPANGDIVHTHECMSLPGGKHPTPRALEREASEHAARAGRGTAGMSVLHVDPGTLKPNTRYKVDTKTHLLVEVPPPTRKA